MCRALLSACAVLLLAGCGSDSEDDARERRGPVRDSAPVPGITQRAAAPAITAPLKAKPPAARPRRPKARVDRAGAAVVRRWSAALRAGKVERAADYFAQPSKVRNGTDLITLRTREQRLAFNVSLPCGAIPTDYGTSPRGYLIVTFRLTERVGGDCGGAAGNRARCAIRVRGGRISEWYRLSDPPPPEEQDQPFSTVGGAV